MIDSNCCSPAGHETVSKTGMLRLSRGMWAASVVICQRGAANSFRTKCPVDARAEWPVVGRRPHFLNQAMVAGWVVLSLSALSACSKPYSCGGSVYRGDCVLGEEGTVPAGPAAVSPGTAPASAAVPVGAGAGGATPAAVGPAVVGPSGVGHGEPSNFADVDDKQCRSYGLRFGTRDYADCRIRLSAQHRGLDPNIGETAPGAGNR
jgi:hypothetical protein